jgi:hypothetical protein
MERISGARILAYGYCLILFGLSAFFGTQGPGDFRDSENALQQACSIAVMLYGILGALAFFGLLLRQRWSIPVAIAWSFPIVAAAILAPLAWAPGEVPWWSILLGGVFAAALGGSVVLVLRRLLVPTGAEAVSSSPSL